MCVDAFKKAYAMFVARWGRRLPSVEQYFPELSGDLGVTEDDIRNEPSIYRKLFSDDCRGLIEEFYRSAILKMRGTSYEDAADILEALAFIQEVTAIALWRFDCPMSRVLKEFARDFDRLDVPEERYRLYQSAQT